MKTTNRLQVVATMNPFAHYQSPVTQVLTCCPASLMHVYGEGSLPDEAGAPEHRVPGGNKSKEL